MGVEELVVCFFTEVPAREAELIGFDSIELNFRAEAPVSLPRNIKDPKCSVDSLLTHSVFTASQPLPGRCVQWFPSRCIGR